VKRRLAVGIGVVALVAAVILTYTLARQATHAPARAGATPTVDAAVESYRAMVNADENDLNFQFTKRFGCKTRSSCADEIQQVIVVAQKMLTDVTGAPAPAPFGELSLQLGGAVQQFISQMKLALSIVQEPDSDYVAASAAPTMHDVDLAAGLIVCWPHAPSLVHGGPLTPFVCGTT